MLEFDGFEIYWDGHATVRIVDKDFTVLVDPYGPVLGCEEADLVFITHRDEGHYDRKALKNVCGDSTCVVVHESLDPENVPCQDVEVLSDQDVVDIFGIEIEAVPMYGMSHEKGDGAGYRFVMRNRSFYVAGDAGLMDEQWDLEGRVDVAFLPVEGVYTMDVEEAIKVAVRIKPRITIPYHYGKPFFKDQKVDLKSFESELIDRNIGVEIVQSGIDRS